MNPALALATDSMLLATAPPREPGPITCTPELRADPERIVGLRQLHEAAEVVIRSAMTRRRVPIESAHVEKVFDEDGACLGAVGIVSEDETRGPVIEGKAAEPELFETMPEEHGWSVKVKRNGATYQYGLFSRRDWSVLLSIDPLADEEADVFISDNVLRNAKPKSFLCRAILLDIHGAPLPPGFTRHRCLADVFDWQTVAASGGPTSPVYVRDDAGRHGMGWMGTDGRWRVACGRTDPARVIAWAVMEADA